MSVSSPARFDAVVIGAGFSGLYALHRLREQGLRVVVLEKAENVGGTWLFNRYPGARCDIESIEYSYSFSDEIQQEWVWTETMPAQPEIEAYLNFVADRLDLRRDIHFDTEVAAMTFDEDAAEWLVQTAAGESFVAPFVVVAAGILSVPLEPDIAGMDTFDGLSLFTNRWPKEHVDLTGRRVGVIGTGSTGVQLIPVVAQKARHLTVFQRSPAYTLPWRVRAFDDGELDELKANYAAIRAAQREHAVGAARLSAFSVMFEMMAKPPLKTATRQQQVSAIEEGGVIGALSWGDVFFDIEANQMAAKLYGEAVARIVEDPETAASLTPTHPFGCKRPIIDQGYYQTFNRDNVTLVDLRKGPIVEVTPTGIRTENGSHELDVIIYATGFDAMTGALTRIATTGRDGTSLGDFWTSEGPYAYLGIAVAGFPNLFIVQAPGSPAPASNFVTALEQHVEWIGDCIAYLRANGYRTIEALPDAQREWVEHTTSLVAPTVLAHPTCSSWYNGGNVPGKKRMYMGYTAGIPEYRRRCDEVAEAGYTGFKLG
ncbi:cyclohexanone monooxygenase [Mycolicibacterium celeriflavum]|uniref:Cyclohexanone monooxygenase n=1 Tax=Mycolicibacterium celeriflavum TaxID=1249101 RepID=A0A1X0BX02_MYCCF|nr:NAD(P)/FAD-dependent oxidoreductase [Mycolicibacterium celeriflavum]MCV7240611.1 NAD(P)/FAD-dependent oxidoreductase [Mycolicibacterium celeriflavum]OBG24350.1 cyclohexanone monooxygenase [Mycolicibacterium celeriflavum]ORA48092.1 cyclohexanone monooxygenase [Mycolicibacterium celeriflavum]BBY43458.1 cyclohexanone monooxygenase [Mycolicibacterium celeriflavum]